MQVHQNNFSSEKNLFKIIFIIYILYNQYLDKGEVAVLKLLSNNFYEATLYLGKPSVWIL